MLYVGAIMIINTVGGGSSGSGSESGSHLYGTLTYNGGKIATLTGIANPTGRYAYCTVGTVSGSTTAHSGNSVSVKYTATYHTASGFGTTGTSKSYCLDPNSIVIPEDSPFTFEGTGSGIIRFKSTAIYATSNLATGASCTRIASGPTSSEYEYASYTIIIENGEITSQELIYDDAGYGTYFWGVNATGTYDLYIYASTPNVIPLPNVLIGGHYLNRLGTVADSTSSYSTRTDMTRRILLTNITINSNSKRYYDLGINSDYATVSSTHGLFTGSSSNSDELSTRRIKSSAISGDIIQNIAKSYIKHLDPGIEVTLYFSLYTITSDYSYAEGTPYVKLVADENGDVVVKSTSGFNYMEICKPTDTSIDLYLVCYNMYITSVPPSRS